jgi:probable HAF family extracellular repeat protein
VDIRPAWIRPSLRAFVAAAVIGLIVTIGPAGVRSADGGQPAKMADFGGRLGREAIGRSINEHGQLAGSFIAKDGAFHAFYTIGHKVVDLGPGDAYAINDLGQVAGSLTVGDHPHAFFLDGTGVHDLGVPDGGDWSIAFDLNNEGQVVGKWSGPDVRGYRPFLWDEAGMQDLGTLGGDYAEAFAINDAGQIVGDSWTATETHHPFLYDATGMHDLRPIIGAAAGGAWTIAGLDDINNGGQVVGQMWPASGGIGEAFSFDLASAAFQPLEPLVPNEFVFASSINDAGLVVGWARPPAGVGSALCHAVLWSGGSARDLGTLGGASSFAVAINEGGLITGAADTRSGASHVFTLPTR